MNPHPTRKQTIAYMLWKKVENARARTEPTLSQYREKWRAELEARNMYRSMKP
jgi:hypothetical protein